MADRFYQNLMPDFVAEIPAIEEEQHPIPQQGTNESLLKLLSTPYHTLSEKFKRAALDLKETIVVETWGLTRQQVPDFTLYCGTLGTAFLLFKAYQVTKNTNDLAVCSQIVKDCDSASRHSRDVTFLCGRAGVCALGAVVAKYMGDDQLVFYYVSQFKEIKLTKDLPDELLYGRAGYLWASLFINKYIGKGTIPSTITAAVINEIIKNGRKLGGKGRSPLMHEWYGELYWGAAHGLAGIMHVLMHFELKPDDLVDVKGTLKYMVKNRFPSGNYPASEEDRRRDILVHWCHGAPGIALTLVKAAEADEDESNWRRKKLDEEPSWSHNPPHVISQFIQCFTNAMVGPRAWIGGIFNRSSNKRLGSDKYLNYSLTPLQEALRDLWNAAFPIVKLKSLISEQWKDMGWQGANPSTDFRGCGFISLENLLYFATRYPACFHRLLFKQSGLRATWEYPFAVAGINVTFMLIQMLDLFSEKPKCLPGLNFVKLIGEDDEAFDVLYCIAFAMMDAQWLAMRASYMDFNDVLQATRTQLERELSLDDIQRIEDLPAFNLI